MYLKIYWPKYILFQKTGGVRVDEKLRRKEELVQINNRQLVLVGGPTFSCQTHLPIAGTFRNETVLILTQY